MPSGQDLVTIPAAKAIDARPSALQAPRLEAVPWLDVTYDELKLLPLDHRDGFIVSLIDGRSTIEMIADMSGMSLSTALGILAYLSARGVITLHDAI